MDAQALITWIIIGLVAGFLASLVVGGGGIVYYIIIGILGSFVGGFLAQQFGIKLNLGNPLIEQIIVAAVGAIVLVFIVSLIV